MQLCRECDKVLWQRHECCPSCRARSPHARTVLTLPGTAGRHVRLAAAVAVSAPVALAAVDQVLHWLLTAA